MMVFLLKPDTSSAFFAAAVMPVCIRSSVSTQAFQAMRWGAYALSEGRCILPWSDLRMEMDMA